MKLKAFVKNNFLWLFLPAIIYLGLFLVFPAFNIIDDGATLTVSQNLKNDISWNNWSDILVEEEVGRFRPFYHLSFYLIYNLFGAKPFFFWLIQALILGSTLVVMATFLYKQTNSYYTAAIFPIFSLFFSPIAKNMFRLGTAEPKQFLLWGFILLLINSVKNSGWTIKRALLAMMLFVLVLFLKETSIIFASIFLFPVLWDLILTKKKSLAEILIIIPITVLVVLFLTSLPEATSYANGFQINLISIWHSFLSAKLEHAAIFYPLTLAVLATVIRGILDFYKNKKLNQESFFWPVFLLSQIVLILGVGIFPWKHQLPRYFYPVHLISILYIALEFNQWTTIFTNNRRLNKLQLVSFLTAGAAFIQIVIFKSSLKLNLNPAEIMSKLEYFKLNHTPILTLFLIISGISLIRLILIKTFRKPKRNINAQDYLWPIWFVSSIMLSIFLSVGVWQIETIRQNYLTLILIAFFLVYEIWSWQKMRLEKWFKNIGSGPILSFFIGLVIILLFINKGPFRGKAFAFGSLCGGILDDLKMSFDTHQISYVLIRDLLTKTENNTFIFTSATDYEVIFEMGLYASNFQQRPIILYTENEQLINDVGLDYPYLKLELDPTTAFIESTQKNKILVVRKKMANETMDKIKDLVDTKKIKINEFNPSFVFNVIPSEANWVKIEKK